MPVSSPFLQTTSVGLVVAIVGFFSTFPIMLHGLTSVGASPAQAASGLMLAAVAMGLAGMGMSWWRKEPISAAWSSAGIALLAVTPEPEGGFAVAMGAFIIAGTLTMIAGIWRPLRRLAASVPAPLAQAMLAGVLVSLCVVPFQAMAEVPFTALPIVLTWFIVSRFSRTFAVPAAVIAAIVTTGISVQFAFPVPDPIFARPLWTTPHFTWEAALGIGIPLFVVPMATQNIPGLAILRGFGYTPPPGPLLAGVGAASVLSAPFGAPGTSLAAITAAMCANEDSFPDPTQRYRTAIVAGAFYCLFGLLGGLIISVAAVAPPMLLETLTGVALLGIFASSTSAALAEVEYREAAAVTFLTTASGITVIGLSAAVWGLVLGGIVLFLTRRAKTG